MGVEADIFGSLVGDIGQLALVSRAVTVVLVDADTVQLAGEAGNLGADNNARLRSAGT